jgi:hypothetical protein
MNIFASSNCPALSARLLDDKRVVKMVLETAQLLSTAMHMHGDDAAPYKPTHKGHPCTKWVAESGNHYMWAIEHFRALCDEYTNRYRKIHKCAQYLQTFLDYAQGRGFSTDMPKYFVNCTTYKDSANVHAAYIQYLEDKWSTDKRTPTWYRREG